MANQPTTVIVKKELDSTLRKLEPVSSKNNLASYDLDA